MIKANKKGDIYVYPRALGGITKMSLHRDGKCQVGFTAECPGKPKDGSRHWETWRLPDVPPPVRVLRILVPQSELRVFEERQDDGLMWLPAPDEGAVGVVTLILAPPNFVIDLAPENQIGAIQTTLRNAWIFYVRHPIDASLAATIEDARTRMHQGYRLMDAKAGTRSIWWSSNPGHDRQVLELAYEPA